MKTATLLIAGALAASGCASTAMNRVMDSWKGEHIDKVVARWGYPSQERDSRGRKLYVWNDSGTYIVPAFSSTTGSASAFRGTGTFSSTTTTIGGGTISGHCERILEVDDQGIVRGGQWRGNDCCVMTVSGFCATLPNPARQ